MESLKPVAAFLVAIMAVAVAEAAPQNPNGTVHVNGTLYCSSNGRISTTSSSSAKPFHNAKVQVACTAESAHHVIANAPASATTNSNGVYLVVLIPRPNATVSSILSACKIFVLTPLSTCHPSLPSAGLVSDLQFVESVPVGSLYITYLAASGFTIRV